MIVILLFFLIKAKHLIFDKKFFRLEQLIYKMMLGDKITFNYPAEDQKITCVSPYTLDVVYKIVYSAPWS